MSYVYIVVCKDGTFYTGYSPDLENRLKVHNAKRGARYTKSRTPVHLVWQECFTDRKEAMSAEWHLKQLSRQEKMKLVCSKNWCLASMKVNKEKAEDGSS